MKEPKIDIYSADFDENTGISTVSLLTPEGIFTGTAKLHPEDSPSKVAGFRYAELRAWIKYFKFNLKLKRARRAEAYQLMNRCKKHSQGYFIARYRCITLDEEIEALKNNIKLLNQRIKEYSEGREKVKKIIDKKDKNI